MKTQSEQSPSTDEAPAEQTPAPAATVTAEVTDETPLTLADTPPLVRSEAPPTEYDATARQRVGLRVQTDAGLQSVAFVFDPQPQGRPFDKLLAEYARRFDAVPKTETAEEEAEARALAQVDASAWLFSQVMVDVEGMGDERPANWQDHFTPQEKHVAILNGVLYAVTLPHTGPQGVRVSWAALAGAVMRLRVLFDGHDIETRHTLKKADNAILREFGALLEKTQRDATSTGLMFDLAALYDRLKLTAHGYKGGIIPPHHRALAVLNHLTTQASVTRKN